MSISKNGFSRKASVIKLTTQAYLCSKQEHIGRKKTLATATLIAALTAASPAIANTSNSPTQDAITCETKVVCQQLTDSIQAKIDEINAQSNLSKDDKRLRYNLRKQLIAVENQKQKENYSLIDAKLKAQDAKIADLRDALLEN